MLAPPTFQDVLRARQVISRHLPRTPLWSYGALSSLLGCDAAVKHENYQPVGAFKVRGGINLVSRLSFEERGAGVISASTGNHGQSVAYAARLFGVRATIVVPEGANPGKVESMRQLGAEVIFHGRDFEEARAHCEALAQREGYRYVHSGNEPYLIAGVGTITLEILEDRPETEVIIVPVGGGSGAAGACIVAKAVNPAIQVIGVQSDQSPAAFQSWRSRSLIQAPNRTVAEGLATGAPFELPQRILWELLDDFVLVSDGEILQAIALYLEKAHSLAEGAGAAPLAAALKLRDRLAGKKVALVLSGGNLSMEQLRRVIS